MPRTVPRMTTDEDVEAFLDQDLSELDFSQFKRVHFELQSKDARVNMRLPRGQLERVKTEAAKRGIPYQRFIRDLLERGLATLEKV